MDNFEILQKTLNHMHERAKFWDDYPKSKLEFLNLIEPLIVLVDDIEENLAVIEELKEEIEDLEDEIVILENKNDDLRDQIDNLESEK